MSYLVLKGDSYNRKVVLTNICNKPRIACKNGTATSYIPINAGWGTKNLRVSNSYIDIRQTTSTTTTRDTISQVYTSSVGNTRTFSTKQTGTTYGRIDSWVTTYFANGATNYLLLRSDTKSLQESSVVSVHFNGGVGTQRLTHIGKAFYDAYIVGDTYSRNIYDPIPDVYETCSLTYLREYRETSSSTNSSPKNVYNPYNRYNTYYYVYGTYEYITEAQYVVSPTWTTSTIYYDTTTPSWYYSNKVTTTQTTTLSYY